MLNKIPKSDHIIYRSSRDIQKISFPLERYLGITEFTYEKIYKNNSKIKLTNQPEWMSYYYQHHLHLLGNYEKDPLSRVVPGYYLTSTLGAEEVFDKAKAFNIGNGILFVDKSVEYYELYWFTRGFTSENMDNFFITHINLLMKFIPFFKEKAAKIIETAEKERIIRPQIGQICREYTTKIMEEEFLNAIRTKNYPLGKGITLSKQEFNCAMGMIQGKTAKEIAEFLLLSKRTVESYVENMKIKMQCFSKSELISTLLKLNIDTYTKKGF